MNKLERELIVEKKRIEALLKKVNVEQRKLKPDTGRIKVSSKGNYLQLYVKDSKNDNIDGRYLSLSERDLMKTLLRYIQIEENGFDQSLKKSLQISYIKKI